MDRPVPHPALGHPLPNPSSAATSTIYVSPAAGAPLHHHQLRQSHQLPQLSVGDPPLRRGPKRAARGEVGVAEESSALWSQGAAAKPDGAGRNGPSPGLGASPDNRDSSTASPTGTAEQPRKKQKRNKPTLSCFECVERKTKVCMPFSDCLCRETACISSRAACDLCWQSCLLFKTRIRDGMSPELLYATRGISHAESWAHWPCSRPILTWCPLQCDRGRPHCLACMSAPLQRSPPLTRNAGIKRQTECQYAPVANLLE
jgi:hypothetical protein